MPDRDSFFVCFCICFFWYCTKLPSASRVTPPRYHTESGNATPGMAVPKPYLVTIVPYLIIVFDGGKLVMWTN